MNIAFYLLGVLLGLVAHTVLSALGHTAEVFAKMPIAQLVGSALIGGVFIFAWMVLPSFAVSGGILEFGFGKSRRWSIRLATILFSTIAALLLSSLVLLEPCGMFRLDRADCRGAIPSYLLFENDVIYPVVIAHIFGVAVVLIRVFLRRNQQNLTLR